MQTGDVFKDTVLEGTQRTRLHGESNGRDYEVWVTLPPSYVASPERRYPMLLVLDACLHFPLAVTTAAYHALEQTCEEIIVVGVSTSGPVSEHHFGRSIDYAPPGMKADLRDSYITMFQPYFASQGMTEERWEETKPLLFNGGDAFRAFAAADDDRRITVFESHGRIEEENAAAMAATYGDVFGDSSGLLDRLAAARPGKVSVTHEVVPGQGHIGCAPGVFAAGVKALFPKLEVAVPAE